MKTLLPITGIGFALVLGTLALPARAQSATPAQPPAVQDPAATPAMPMHPGARMGQDGPFGWMLGRMATKLHLTDPQKASCRTILDQHKASLAAKRQALAAARTAYREAYAKPDTSLDTLKSLNRALADARLDHQLELRTLRQELRAVLTPEQREQAARMEGRWEGMRQARGGRCAMGPGRMGPRGMAAPPAPAPAS
jgi:Spy/CpxP family protein refolding chaperone